MLIVLGCLVDTTLYCGGFQDRALATDVNDLIVAPGVVNRSTWRIRLGTSLHRRNYAGIIPMMIVAIHVGNFCPLSGYAPAYTQEN